MRKDKVDVGDKPDGLNLDDQGYGRTVSDAKEGNTFLKNGGKGGSSILDTLCVHLSQFFLVPHRWPY